jgi:hypothetical protein
MHFPKDSLELRNQILTEFSEIILGINKKEKEKKRRKKSNAFAACGWSEALVACVLPTFLQTKSHL